MKDRFYMVLACFSKSVLSMAIVVVVVLSLLMLVSREQDKAFNLLCIYV